MSTTRAPDFPNTTAVGTKCWTHGPLSVTDATASHPSIGRFEWNCTGCSSFPACDDEALKRKLDCQFLSESYPRSQTPAFSISMAGRASSDFGDFDEQLRRSASTNIDGRMRNDRVRRPLGGGLNVTETGPWDPLIPPLTLEGDHAPPPPASKNLLTLRNLDTFDTDLGAMYNWARRQPTTTSHVTDVFQSDVDRYILEFGIENTFINAKLDGDHVLKTSATNPEGFAARAESMVNTLVSSSSFSGYDAGEKSEDAGAGMTENAAIENLAVKKSLTEEEIANIPRDEEGRLTSIGSTKHSEGTCRPCAFSNNPKKQGCVNGLHCMFCHFKHPKKKRPPRPSKQQRMLKKLSKPATSGKTAEDDESEVNNMSHIITTNGLNDLKKTLVGSHNSPCSTKKCNSSFRNSTGAAAQEFHSILRSPCNTFEAEGAHHLPPPPPQHHPLDFMAVYNSMSFDRSQLIGDNVANHRSFLTGSPSLAGATGTRIPCSAPFFSYEMSQPVGQSLLSLIKGAPSQIVAADEKSCFPPPPSALSPETSFYATTPSPLINDILASPAALPYTTAPPPPPPPTSSLSPVLYILADQNKVDGAGSGYKTGSTTSVSPYSNNNNAGFFSPFGSGGVPPGHGKHHTKNMQVDMSFKTSNLSGALTPQTKGISGGVNTSAVSAAPSPLFHSTTNLWRTDQQHVLSQSPHPPAPPSTVDYLTSLNTWAGLELSPWSRHQRKDGAGDDHDDF